MRQTFISGSADDSFVMLSTNQPLRGSESCRNYMFPTEKNSAFPSSESHFRAKPCKNTQVVPFYLLPRRLQHVSMRFDVSHSFLSLEEFSFWVHYACTHSMRAEVLWKRYDSSAEKIEGDKHVAQAVRGWIYFGCYYYVNSLYSGLEWKISFRVVGDSFLAEVKTSRSFAANF